MKTLQGLPLGGGDHRWSGWPGAHCLYCGAPDRLEEALADNWFDPFENTWDTPEHEREIKLSRFCPVVPLGVDPHSLPFPLTESDYGNGLR